MDLIKTLKTKPNSKVKRLSILIFTIIIILLMFAGTFLVANQLAGGTGGFETFMPFDIFGAETRDFETLPPISESETVLPEWVAVPDVALTPWNGTGRVTVLVMGLDYRDWSAGEGPSRTDTMMLLTMDPLENTAGMLSVPRDLWVSIPGFENGRINTAYFLGRNISNPRRWPWVSCKNGRTAFRGQHQLLCTS